MAKTQDLKALLSADAPKADSSGDDAARTRDIARKMAQLNPALKGEASTEEFIVSAQGALRRSPGPTAGKPATSSAPAAAPRATSTDQLIAQAQQQYEQEKREIDAAAAILSARAARLKDKHLCTLMDGLHALDPNLQGLLTTEALKARKVFLDALGFSAARYLEHVRKK